MLHPSYNDLMRVVNQDVEEGETKIVNSRYSIVLATSKRARQIVNGERAPLVPVKGKEKPLSIAIKELNEGQLKILASHLIDENLQEEYESAIAAEELPSEEIFFEEVEA